MSVKQWLWNILVALDQLLNTLVKGDPDETLSSRAAKARDQNHSWGCILCAILDFIDPNHCNKFLEYDEGKRVSTLAPQTIHLQVYQNSSFLREVPTSLDLAGLTLQGKFARTWEPEETRYTLRTKVLYPDSDNANFRIEIRVNPNDTADLFPERYLYDVAIVAQDSNGEYYRLPLISGILDLIPSVG